MNDKIKHKESWGRLCEFLDEEDDGVRQERLQSASELGIDISRLAVRLKCTARQSIQNGIREEADRQRLDMRSDEAFLKVIAAWPANKIIAWLEEVRNGSLGDEARLLVEPCFRNKNQERSTEAELRSQAADVFMAASKKSR